MKADAELAAYREAMGAAAAERQAEAAAHYCGLCGGKLPRHAPLCPKYTGRKR